MHDRHEIRLVSVVTLDNALCVELCVFRLPHAVVHHDVVLLGHVDAISGPTTSKAHAVSVWMHRLGFLHVGSEC